MVTAIKTVDIGKLISRDPEIWHGLPIIAGTRKTVMGVVSLHLIDGAEPDDIARRKELTLGQVYAALAYYYANQKQMDKEIAVEQAEYDRLAEEARRTNSRS